MAHAVRIASEAIELCRDGFITLPRPEAPRLMAIRRGEIPAEDVGAEIADLMAKIELAEAASSLPAEFDRALAEDILYEAYRDEVTRGFSHYET